HPNGKGLVNPLIGRIGTIAANAIVNRPESATPPPSADPVRARSAVLPGLDVLERDQFQRLQGRRVGLITNHTGVNRRGVGTAQLLSKASGVKLVALFSPEHGIAGQLD